MCIGNGNSQFPFLPRESRKNGNTHGVIRERDGMGIDNCEKNLHTSQQSVMSDDTKSV